MTISTRTDAIRAINELLGGAEREAAERVADALHSQHPRWEDVVEAVLGMDDAAFFALAAAE